jgi:hypothetical protein
MGFLFGDLVRELRMVLPLELQSNRGSNEETLDGLVGETPTFEGCGLRDGAETLRGDTFLGVTTVSFCTISGRGTSPCSW